MVNTIIIGLGQIGQLYDYNFTSDKFNLTHAQALCSDSRYNLLAGIDSDSNRRTMFHSKFQRPVFANIHELSKVESPELVVIATPPDTHQGILNEVLCALRPRAILCEKPISHNLHETNSMFSACENLGVDIFVNFIRRTDPAILELKSIITKELGTSRFNGFCWYCKGLYNTASHFMDVFQFLFGTPRSWNFRRKANYKNQNNDPQVDFKISFIDGDIEFKSVPNGKFFYNRFELIFENFTVSYQQNGDLHVAFISNSGVSNDRTLVSSATTTLKADMGNYQKRVYDEIFKALKGKSHLLATKQEIKCVSRIFEELKNGGKVYE